MEKYCPKCFKKYPPEAERCAQDGSYLVTPMDRDLTGETLDDRYTVLERIGRGGMGVVYKAEQHLIKRVVALKVLRREIVQDETAVKRFLNEARAIASLDNPHTVTLHDFGVTRDGLLYYTMELLKGRPLSKIIREQGPFDHVRATNLILQACRSLDEAHEHGILHRDIKPDNLFVEKKAGTATGLTAGREVLKVLDFGIAKLVGDAGGDTVTRTGMIIGTPQYLSPEQALGNAVVPASDLYSLAIVLYEMLAGRPPFADETPMKTMWAHVRDPVPPLTKINPNVQVPRSIEAFLAKALEKEPKDRFQTAAEFSAALEQAVREHAEQPMTVPLQPLAGDQAGLRVRTQPFLPVSGASTPAPSSTPAPTSTPHRTPAGAGVPWTSPGSDSDSRTPVLSSRPASRSRLVALASAVAVLLVVAVGLAIFSYWKGGSARSGDEGASSTSAAPGRSSPAAPPSAAPATSAAPAPEATPASSVAPQESGGAEEADAQKEAEERARIEAEAAARAKLEVEARLASEVAARLSTEEKARLEVEAVARAKAEVEARLASEVAARLSAEEKARVEAEAAAKAKAEVEARLASEAAAKKQAEVEVRLASEAAARKQAEVEVRLASEAAAKRQAEENARLKAEAVAWKKAEEEARKAAEAEAREQEKEEALAVAEAERIAREHLQLAQEQEQREAEEEARALQLEALLNKAEAAAEDGDFDTCINTLKAALKMDPKNEWAMEAIKQCKEMKALQDLKM